jgi:hypothetical protein
MRLVVGHYQVLVFVKSTFKGGTFSLELIHYKLVKKVMGDECGADTHRL